jgi:hypothetical protein
MRWAFTFVDKRQPMNREVVRHLDNERRQCLERIMNAIDGTFDRIGDAIDAAERRLIQILAGRRKHKEHTAAAA